MKYYKCLMYSILFVFSFVLVLFWPSIFISDEELSLEVNCVWILCILTSLISFIIWFISNDKDLK